MNVDEDSKPVRSDEWEHMSYDELVEQRIIMTDRYDYLMRIEQFTIAEQVEQGLERLENLIKSKT